MNKRVVLYFCCKYWELGTCSCVINVKPYALMILYIKKMRKKEKKKNNMEKKKIEKRKKQRKRKK